MLSGLKLASRYGIYPQKLGFCGPRRSRFATLRGKPAKNSAYNQLYNFILGKKVCQKKIRKIMEAFEGAFFYYKLIAKSNKIKDPFDEKVVEAYWTGNNLLEKVKTEDFKKMIAGDFSKPGLLSKRIAEKKAKEMPKGAKPHHSFHVLVIGSVTGRVRLEGKLLDLCRVSWGKALRIKKPEHKTKSFVFGRAHKYGLWLKNKKLKIIIEYQPLTGRKKIKLGKPKTKEIIWDRNLAPEITIGDWVSFHWDHLIQKLNKKEIYNLEKYTKHTLKILRR